MGNTNKESEIMCSQADVKNMVHQAFDEENGIRTQIKADIKKELKLAVFQVFAAVGLTLIGGIIGISIYLANLRSDVDTLLEFASSGDRFTQSDALILSERVENNTEALRGVAQRGDLQRVEETLIRLDERVRNEGI